MTPTSSFVSPAPRLNGATRTRVLRRGSSRTAARRRPMAFGGYTPRPVPCGGCDEPIPVAVGPDASHGEWRMTGLGLSYHRTHQNPVCVDRMQEVVGGRLFIPPTDPLTGWP
jgi:hypothetical protein